ncbi:MAG: glycosyltransferase family 2 protein [Actinomycetota bacterium]|nr:glycosyltransferase family 2 protein [Actinomycetota bacterium]
MFAVTMVRDEHDVVAHVLRHLLGEGVDHIIVADNRSADSTAQIVADVGRNSPVPPVRDSNRAYFRTEKMTRLARAAFLRGASWVIPFDADEIWTAPGTGLAQFLRSSQDDVIFARIFDHVPTPTDRAPAAEPNPFIRLQHRTVEPTGLAKVAFRASLLARLHMGNHDVDRLGSRGEGLEIRHFPYRTAEQYVSKMRAGSVAIAATDLPPIAGHHWREAARASDGELCARWEAWRRDRELVVDPAAFRG